MVFLEAGDYQIRLTAVSAVTTCQMSCQREEINFGGGGGGSSVRIQEPSEIASEGVVETAMRLRLSDKITN